MRAFVVAVAVLTASCVETVPRTQVTLEVDAEPAVRDMSTSVLIEVFGGPDGALSSEPIYSQRFLLSDPGVDWPIRVALVPRDNDATRVFEVRAEAQRDDASLIRNGVRGSFVQQFTSTLRLVLYADCLTAMCQDGQVCVENGLCIDDIPDSDCSDPASMDPMPDCEQQIEFVPTHVAAGGRHTCIIDDFFQVWCWGDNTEGQVDLLVEAQDVVTTPTLTFVAGATDIAAGEAHTCAIVDGAVWCWGRGTEGQLGPDAVESANFPSPIAGLTDVRAIAAGGNHTCVIRSDTGDVVCWGANDDGQLGRGTAVMAPDPMPMNDRLGVPVSGVDVLATGVAHTCVSSGSNDWFGCVGDNQHGQLGDGTIISRSTMTQVTGTSFVSLGVGESHSCGRSGDEILCWGDGSLNQLSTIGSTSTMPTGIDPNGVNVEQVVAGDDFVCIRAFDVAAVPPAPQNQVLCWGDNADGQLGDGMVGEPTATFPLLVDDEPTLVAAGARHACAITLLGLLCWGDNAEGQLGDGSAGGGSSVPVLVQTFAFGDGDSPPEM